RRGGERPAAAAIEGGSEYQSLRAAVGPAILLPGGDQVRRVEGIGDERRLDRRVGKKRAARRHDAIASGGERGGLRYLHLLHRGERGRRGDGYDRGGVAAAAAGCNQCQERNDPCAALCIHAICFPPSRTERSTSAIDHRSARVMSSVSASGYEDRRGVLQALLQRLDHGC